MGAFLICDAARAAQFGFGMPADFERDGQDSALAASDRGGMLRLEIVGRMRSSSSSWQQFPFKLYVKEKPPAVACRGFSECFKSFGIRSYAERERSGTRCSDP
jgi:hypothetical protein